MRPTWCVDTTVPIDVAKRFLRRSMPTKMHQPKRREAVWRMDGAYVVGGSALTGTGTYPRAFGESMAKMAIHLLGDATP